MRKVIHKVFFLWDFDKEENWINYMASIGLNLVSVGFARYEFEEGKPNEYIYRLEMLEHLPTHPESQDYIRFVEETGAENVGVFKTWVFFRRKASDGEFDIHSDIDSRIKHIEKMKKLAYLCFGIMGTSALYLITSIISLALRMPLESFIYEMIFPMVIWILGITFLARGFSVLKKKKEKLVNERSLRE